MMTEFYPKSISELRRKPQQEPIMRDEFETEFFKLQDRILGACDKYRGANHIQAACVAALDDYWNRVCGATVNGQDGITQAALDDEFRLGQRWGLLLVRALLQDALHRLDRALKRLDTP